MRIDPEFDEAKHRDRRLNFCNSMLDRVVKAHAILREAGEFSQHVPYGAARMCGQVLDSVGGLKELLEYQIGEIEKEDS